MSSILTSLQNLLSALLSTITSAFESVFAVFSTLIAQIYSLCLGLFNFLLGNIVIIGILAAAFVGYTVYAQRQGGRVKGKKNL
ncbi:MAG: hypothetical protein Q9187_004391 [Circinaria calcarea]